MMQAIHSNQSSSINCAPRRSSNFRRRVGYVGAQRRLARRRSAYLLLETIVATGMLIIGLSVIGAQVQSADQSIHEMRLRTTAVTLAERFLAELEMGLIDLDSVDEIADGDFGPRYPDFGWRLTTSDTALDDVFLVQLDVLHLLRVDEYTEDDFEADDADLIFTVYAMRSLPKPVSFSEDFGLSEDEVLDLRDRFDELGIEGLDIDNFSLAWLQGADIEELLKVLPLVLDTFGMDISEVAGALPPGMLEQLRDSGLLEDDAVNGLLEELGIGDVGAEEVRP